MYFRNPLYATRATLVSTEALKSRKMFNEAALQFIKLTSEVSTTSDTHTCILILNCSVTTVGA